METPPTSEKPLTPAQACAAFNVHPDTLRRWANTGRLRTFRTAGGHRRYLRTDVEQLLADLEASA